jgi:hypothetical protein
MNKLPSADIQYAKQICTKVKIKMTPHGDCEINSYDGVNIKLNLKIKNLYKKNKKLLNISMEI